MQDFNGPADVDGTAVDTVVTEHMAQVNVDLGGRLYTVDVYTPHERGGRWHEATVNWGGIGSQEVALAKHYANAIGHACEIASAWNQAKGLR